MKLVIQRVAKASVEVDGEVVSHIGHGLLLLLGIRKGDTLKQAQKLAAKVVKLRMWEDMKDPGKLWASSVADRGYEILVVSQFTLFATFAKPKPNYAAAMGGEEAKALYEAFVDLLRKEVGDTKVATGIFGAMMQVDLRNDGPVTVELVADPDVAPEAPAAGEGTAGSEPVPSASSATDTAAPGA
mmetsp:Transcript_90878/g.257410  ORF Transcript_90878/g.257410 Transcript_90878/m.257410 type:complete len:185 (+) Transcript_90878:96-650(+)